MSTKFMAIAGAVTDAPSRFHTSAVIPADINETFLKVLAEYGQVTYAANVAGMTRRGFYDRRTRDPEFARAWDEALDMFEESLTHRVVETAIAMGTGRWVPALDENGEPELDEEFEPLMRFDCSHVDPRVAIKLMSLRMNDVNAPKAPLVQVQQNSFGGGSATQVTHGETLDLDALAAEMAADDEANVIDAEDADWQELGE